jgi:hypothetical protein
MTKAQHARGPYPLSVQPAGERFNVITNQGNFYAMTYDPAVAALIVAAAEAAAERDGLKTEVDHLRQIVDYCADKAARMQAQRDELLEVLQALWFKVESVCETQDGGLQKECLLARAVIDMATGAA